MSRKQAEAQIDDEGARGFAHILQQFGEGAFHSEISEELRDAVKKLEAHALDFGKAKGRLTLTLNIVADREGSLVVINPEVAVKLPKPARKAGVFWINKAGNLVSENPKQTKLPLRAVETAPIANGPDTTEATPRVV